MPLPSAAEFRADLQRMVDFGPRLPGSPAHNAYCDWLEDEFVKAGLELQPADQFAYTRWDPQRYALEIVDGPSPGPLKVAFPFVRSAATGPQGIVGPLSYAGGTSGGAKDSILVIDVPAPAKASAAIFLELASYLYWPGHTTADWAMMDYTRPWVGPWPNQFSNLSPKAVVLISTGSYEGLAGGFSPHQAAASTPVPVMIVDRDTGATLRQQALSGQHAKVTLEVESQKSTMRTVTAILPGRSKETIIVNTHSDGQNAIEENAGVALVEMARHLGSLPPGQRLTRTLAFTVWAAHMTDPSFQPELDGWMADHPDLVTRAVAGVTLEHLGCTEWLDDPTKGYHGTGQNEIYGIWTTQGPTLALAEPLLSKYKLDRHMLLHGPVEFTVGYFLQSKGIPNVGGIAGPTYLLVISDSGEIEKLDFALASRQIGFYSDMVKAFDRADPNALRSGDPTLGAPVANAQSASNPNKSTPVIDGPAGRFITDDGKGNRLAIRFYGHRRHHRGMLVSVVGLDNPLAGITLELRRGATLYARSAGFKATSTTRQVYLHRHANKKFPAGTYTLVIRQRGIELGSHSVHLRTSAS